MTAHTCKLCQRKMPMRPWNSWFCSSDCAFLNPEIDKLEGKLANVWYVRLTIRGHLRAGYPEAAWSTMNHWAEEAEKIEMAP